MLRHTLKSTLTTLLIYGICATLLFGCSGTTETSQQKVAMHVDAILGFAVEYPQLWHKEILVDWQSDEGQVHWSESMQTEVVSSELRVYSRKKTAAMKPAKVLESALKSAHPGFEIIARGLFELPAGEAQHLLGYTPQLNYAGYLLQTDKREYLIKFSAPADSFDSYRGLFNEILESFIILNADESTRAH
jgi:hypothetical protein